MKRSATYYLVVMALLGATAVLSWRLAHSDQTPPSKKFLLFPDRIEHWIGTDVPISASVLDVVGADDILNRTYLREDGAPIFLYVGYYGSQTRGDQIHSPLHCYPGSGWKPIRKGVVPVHLEGKELFVNRMLIQKGLEKRLVVYWYQAQGRAIANEYVQRLHLIWTSFTAQRTDGALIRVSTPVTEERVEEGWQAMMAFLNGAYPLLLEFLPG